MSHRRPTLVRLARTSRVPGDVSSSQKGCRDVTRRCNALESISWHGLCSLKLCYAGWMDRPAGTRRDTGCPAAGLGRAAEQEFPSLFDDSAARPAVTAQEAVGQESSPFDVRVFLGLPPVRWASVPVRCRLRISRRRTAGVDCPYTTRKDSAHRNCLSRSWIDSRESRESLMRDAHQPSDFAT